MKIVSPPDDGPELFDDGLQRRFLQYHRANPHVMAALVRLARAYHAKGQRRGIGHLYEVLRYEHWLQTDGDDFKLNNNWRSRYARFIMDENPDLRGFFDLRALTAIDNGEEE